MRRKYTLKRIGEHGLRDALELAWQVFLEFEAPEYPLEGVTEFERFIAYEPFREKVETGAYLLWGAYDGDKIVGVVSASYPCHISLLFVLRPYQHQGIARALVAEMLQHFRNESECDIVTVHSSPYAMIAYERLGFVPVDGERTENGLRYVPMEYRFR